MGEADNAGGSLKVNILFCGTAAAEAWPALFCACPACHAARQRGGKDLRSRAAYMIGEEVRVDFGPDSNLHHHRYGLEFERLRHLLVTHSHEDHWFPQDLLYRRAGFSVVDQDLTVWGNPHVRSRFEEVGGTDWGVYQMEFREIEPFKPITLSQDLTATPLLAAHDTRETCVNYLLESNGSRALLAHDTGWYPAETWDFLASARMHLVAVDCTYGIGTSDRNHLGGEAVILLRNELARRGALAHDARVFVTHFSHNGGMLHRDLEAFFVPHGIEVAYDGLTLDV